ncbi:MAG: NAD-binding oxidoreductase [Alphaproteobacteria bacterium MedPE-SWcel]|nr:MAG: NAD-binding oxidoreductase [Alphaproteobacteria bacterium MedPE-SWcel]
MSLRFFSSRHRPVHLGPFPLERLKRLPEVDMSDVPRALPLNFRKPDQPANIVNAMCEYQAMMDAIRDGLVNGARADVPDDLRDRSDHIKAFGYFADAAMVGIGPMDEGARLPEPWRNPDIDRLAEDLKTRQTKTLASGIDVIMADLKDALQAPPTTIGAHKHAIVFLYETPRAPMEDEAGCEWIRGAETHRACLRSAETAVVIANYIRLLGWDAKAHTGTSSDVDLNRLAVAAGIARIEKGKLVAPYLGTRFGLAVVTTDLDLAEDLPLAPMPQQPGHKGRDLRWWIGAGAPRSALNGDPYDKRAFCDGPHPFETLKRVEVPTTYIDEARVARVPKRTDMFARAQFGDMGPANQRAATGGHYVRKAAPSMAQRRMLGAFVLLQDGAPAAGARPADAARNALSVKAASYWLGVDAVGISRCPDWAWYSHDATGTPIVPDQPHAISMIIDQGFDTTEGTSGDDWIAVAQSMRAYLRFSLLGGVIAKQIRNLGYQAKAHTVMDGEVLQPPLLLLSGLGEVSRIGEVILNPFLGPRLKSGVVTTDMPLTHDKPIDFGLQAFCQSCNKCARECPAGAITAGPKLMFNGYEIWKSDSQKCTTYRITTPGGAMCGRCMKTCPWNLEGIFAEKPFRWAAMTIPKAAPALARLDDALGHGDMNPVKKWWWDLELQEDGAYRPTRNPVNHRSLATDLDLQYRDQTLAVYPANLAPHPYPYPFPMDREAGIEAYQAMVTAKDYRARRARGESGSWDHRYETDRQSPVLPVLVSKVETMTEGVTKYEFRAIDGGALPAWTAGAHIDIVVAPEFLRQYSLSGNPADRSRYQIGVLCEDAGRGGSKLLHRIFTEGRRVFISRPINHFPLNEAASKTYLMGGGIGITPLIAMAHRLHALERPFELHYSISSRDSGGFLKDLSSAPWADRGQVHISTEGTRAKFRDILGHYDLGCHVYTCGAAPYMDAVVDAARAAGYPEEACHREYFSVPEQPDLENHAFTLRLSRSGRDIPVSAEQTAAEALQAHGVKVNVKCSDGICGVCKCSVVSGNVEHRDFVLSKAQRAEEIILCKSRAAEPEAILEIDL